MEPKQGPERGESQAVGVCYVTAAARGSEDVSSLRVRIELTSDVSSGKSAIRYAIGPDAVSEIVTEWMRAMCDSRS